MLCHGADGRDRAGENSKHRHRSNQIRTCSNSPPVSREAQDSSTSAAKQLGTTLDDALQAKQVARLSVIVKCNHYDVIEVIYRDGSIKVVDDPRAPIGRNEPLDRDQLDRLANTLPGFVWGEIECDS